MEWARSRSRALRWIEETGFLSAEMHRALLFCEWAASFWETRLTTRTNVDDELKEGIRSYAHERILAENRLRSHWEAKWATIRRRADVFLNPTSEEAATASDTTSVIEVQLPDEYSI